MITCVRVEASSALRPMLLFLLGALLFAGCGKQEKPSPGNSPSASASPAVSNSASSTGSLAVAGPGPGEKACFQCKGTGTIPCRTCQASKMDCPGPCLKLSKGTWEHKNVAGHSPSELWITFHGAKTFASWSQGHLGEVVVFQNGEPVNIGPCKICGGTTTVTCTVCKGQGKVPCEICSGKKFIPVTWCADRQSVVQPSAGFDPAQGRSGDPGPGGGFRRRRTNHCHAGQENPARESFGYSAQVGGRHSGSAELIRCGDPPGSDKNARRVLPALNRITSRSERPSC